MQLPVGKGSTAILLLVVTIMIMPAGASQSLQQENLDQQVRAFLEQNRRSWRDMNVPVVDGQKLYDLIVENDYTRALEIGTSTGHSGIWIAWALSKTGGKLITIEIDERRYREAVANFEEAGLSPYIDARLANAHELVPELEGPFDFVFSDADKGWYKNYFLAVLPKLEIGGCFTAHNVRAPSGSGERRRRGSSGTSDFVQELLATPEMETEFFTTGGGLSVSFKREPADPWAQQIARQLR
jgi:predicted O-methyltransferase YrrM